MSDVHIRKIKDLQAKIQEMTNQAKSLDERVVYVCFTIPSISFLCVCLYYSVHNIGRLSVTPERRMKS